VAQRGGRAHLRWIAAKVTGPHLELDLGPLAHRVDDNNSRDGHSIHGHLDPPPPGSDARRECVVACVNDHDGVNRCGRVPLAVLHGLQAVIWAAAYWWLGALPSAQEALLYSVDSITTRGSSGLILERGWRMMGALEAADGMLLFGISTAFIFAVMQEYAPLIHRRPHHIEYIISCLRIWARRDPSHFHKAISDTGAGTESLVFTA
jgi:hypothetical protein